MTPQIVSSSPVAARAPSLRRRMACFVYEGLMLFGIGLVPGAIGALFLALTGHAHPLQSDAALRIITFVIYGNLFHVVLVPAGANSADADLAHPRRDDRWPASEPDPALLRYLASCIWFAPAALLASLNHWARWDALAAIGIGVIAYALLALLQPQRQFWHDVACGTQLVDAPLLPRHKR